MSTNEQMDLAKRLSEQAYVNGPRGRTGSAPNPAHRTAATPQQRLAAMSDAELAALLTDGAKFAELLRSLAEVQQVQAVRNDLLGKNAELARKNVARTEKLRELQNQIAVVRSSEYADATTRYEEASAEYRAVQQVVDADGIARNLRAAAAADERESEELVDRFKASGGGAPEVRDFVRDYLQLRKRFHVRDLKQQALALQGIGCVSAHHLPGM